MSNMINILKTQEFLKDLNERELIEISPNFELMHTMPRQVLFEKGQPIQFIYLVLYGSYKIQETIDKKTVKIFNFLSRNEFLGVAMAGLQSPRYPTSAISNENGTLLKIPIDFFFNTLMQNPQLRRIVNRQISERFLEFQNDVCKSHKLTSMRIADFILRLLDRQGAEQAYIQIPLTRVDIADRIGSQCETVIRILSQWTKKGWIRTESRHIVVLDRQALVEEASGEKSNIETATGASANPEDAYR